MRGTAAGGVDSTSGMRWRPHVGDDDVSDEDLPRTGRQAPLTNLLANRAALRHLARRMDAEDDLASRAHSRELVKQLTRAVSGGGRGASQPSDDDDYEVPPD
jgi:hypothetical protein